MRDIYNQRPYLCLYVGDGNVKLEMPAGIQELKIMHPSHQHHTKPNYLNLPPDQEIIIMKDHHDFKNEIIANIILNVVASFFDITTKQCWSYYGT